MVYDGKSKDKMDDLVVPPISGNLHMGVASDLVRMQLVRMQQSRDLLVLLV